MQTPPNVWIQGGPSQPLASILEEIRLVMLECQKRRTCDPATDQQAKSICVDLETSGVIETQQCFRLWQEGEIRVHQDMMLYSRHARGTQDTSKIACHLSFRLVVNRDKQIEVQLALYLN